MPSKPTFKCPYTRAAIAILIVFTAFCLWFSTTHDLLEDESYYWQWSRHLALGYYDGPPVVAYVIRLGTAIAGNTALGVRCGAVICAAIAAWFVYLLAAALFGGAVALVALIAALVNPLFGAGATLMTLDPPQLLLLDGVRVGCLARASRRSSLAAILGLWVLAGLLAGLATMSKFNGLLILPSILLYLVIDPGARAWLRRPQPYIAAALALAIFAPFVWWNHAHGNAFWIHINAMGSRTVGARPHFTLRYLGEFLGSQAGLISPLLFLTYLWVLATALKAPHAARFTGREAVSGAPRIGGWGASSVVWTSGLRYCWSLSAVVFIATLLLSLKSRVEGNWAVAAYPTGFILVAYAVVGSWKRRLPARAWHSLALGLAAFLTLAIYVSTLTIGGPRITFLDKRTDELYGWRAMAQRVQADRAAMADNPFVFGVNYRMPSEVAFYLPGQPQTYSLFLHDRASEYMFWEDERALVGRDAIMVNDAKTPDHLADARAVFARVVVEPPLLVYRRPGGPPIRTIQIFRCYRFKGYDRSEWQVGW